MRAARILAVLTLFSVALLLTACGGNSGAKSQFAAGTPVTLTIRDAPPAGIAVVSFEVTVNSATLQPGNVPLVSSPRSLELTQLQAITAFLNSTTVPPGTYTGITVSFANPELTIVNDTSSAIAACGVGQTCELKPPIAQATVNYSGAPFPITIAANTPLNLLLDFDLQNSLDAGLSINPVITLRQVPGNNGEMDDIDDLTGQVTAKDAANNQFTLQVGGANGHSVVVKVDSSTEFEDFDEAGMANSFASVAVNQILEVDAALMSGGTLLAKKIELHESERETEGELQGTIVRVNASAQQFDMVVQGETPDIPGVSVGTPITVTIQSGANFSVDTEGASLPGGLSFAGITDLMTGQRVKIKPTSAVSNNSVATMDVRLRPSAITAQIASISGANFVLTNLPALFTTANPSITQMEVMTFSDTEFEDVSGLSALSAGNIVSVHGLLFNTAGTPTVVAEKVRKR